MHVPISPEPARPATFRPVASALAALLLAGAAWGQGDVVPVGSGPKEAQPGTGSPGAPPGAPAPEALADEPTNLQLLKDFLHYTRTHNHELALAMGRALLDRNLPPTEFAALVESSGELARFEETITRVQRSPQAAELETVVSRLLRLYETGKLDQARNPDEVARNIALLTGVARNRLFAVDRLRAAGEYAMPQLLEALLQRQDPRLAAEVRRVMVELGRQAVIPLATALLELDPASQETVIGVLADIGYATSLPFLHDVAAASPSGAVQAAAERAIRKIGEGGAGRASIPALYRDLAEGYYDEPQSLTSFPGEEHQLVWEFDPGVGLIPVPVATPVYHEAMTMRLTERALTLDATDAEALALWLAANFSRELDTPEGYDNPAYPAARRDAMYYAVASGAQASQRVLARALDDRDTPLARKAIAATEQTAGGAVLWSAGSDRRPLIEAMRYPSRRVQYEAALAIGAAQPREPFGGSERVVPVLASAVRDAAARYAVVVASGAERQQSLSEFLRGAGYTVLAPGQSLADAEAVLADAPGADLVVVDFSDRTAAATDRIIMDIRGTPRLGATPVLALATREDFADLSTRHGRDPLTRLARAGVSGQELAAAAEQLSESAGGGNVGPDEAAAYKQRALAVLRDLAISGSAALNVADAAGPLIATLGDNAGPMRLAIAEVLAHVGEPRAQQALMDAALGTGATAPDDRVPMLGKVAQSAKRFGNMLEARHLERLGELVAKGQAEEATAAAALMGALNLPNEHLIPLIVSAPDRDPAGAGETRQ
ncbi:MAG TPA: HEAT repeat domain-containing protein [Phycisphaerales bacterium]|nr:HEAT repeat domain-containing protein [Phycisphaerales bacterium]